MSFDLTNNFPYLGLKCKKIFFAADQPRNKQHYKSARKADLIVSVSQHILDMYKRCYPLSRMLLINHGLSYEFINIQTCLPPKYKGINIGLSGNFLFNDIDYSTLIEIIESNICIQFHFYGNHSSDCNIGADSSYKNVEYVNQIKRYPNCYFHGVLGKRDLAIELNYMDGFLICYNPQNSQSSGSNSHKILEYLSTGKVLVSSNFSHYQGTHLFEMCKERSNVQLNKIFKNVILDLAMHNRNEIQINRRQFAQSNTYENNLSKIISYYPID
jgi:hypothetical protein